MIVDSGSSPELGTYDREGNNCVPQAIYTSAIHT